MSTLSERHNSRVAQFSYRDLATPFPPPEAPPKPTQSAPQGISAQQVEELLSRARAEAVTATETRLRAEFETKAKSEADKIRYSLELFREERRDYFSRVEAEVVQLALSIAAKILHRESQVDPMLVAALVRVTVEKLHDGSKVSVRVPKEDAEKWRAFFALPFNGSSVEVVEDTQLYAGDCILETELGSANFSIAAQLKEVEQGLFDLLAQRPVIR
jgi:flagellar biosynthesis/type III secretory pathway protein FliH